MNLFILESINCLLKAIEIYVDMVNEFIIVMLLLYYLYSKASIESCN